MAPALLLFLSLVNDVRSLIARNDLAGAERLVRTQQAQSGATPDVAAAMSWLARGAFGAKQLDRADSYAIETRTLADQLLRTHKLDSDPLLQTAVGAAIEVHAQVLAARGDRPEALDFLRRQLVLFGTTSLHERIQKNVNLLDMVGKRAPALATGEWLGSKPPALASLRGRPVLLFFWAHWCSDCKGEIAALANMQKTFGPKGLVVIAPTRFYGYVAKGAEAGPAVEKKYIEQVWREFYGPLGNLAIPISSAGFLTYGVSSTPTLVLIDAAGIVREYHPGTLPEAELAARIQAMIKQ